MIADSADALFAALGGRARLRGDGGNAVGRLLAEGWGGLLLDEDRGGLGFGLRGAVVALEAAGRNLAPEPLAGLAVAAQVLDRPDREPRTLPAFAVPDGDGWRTGAVPGLAQAGALAIFCAQDAALRLLPRDAPGLVVDPFATVDGGSSGTAWFPADAGTVLATGAQALALADAARATLRLLAAAELAGLSAAALRLTVDHVETRRQFGAALSSHQVIQHRLADAHVQAMAAQALVYEAVRAFDGGARDAGARAAYRRAARAARLATREAIQFHGGIGFTDDCDIGLFFKRAMALTAALDALDPDLTETAHD